MFIIEWAWPPGDNLMLDAGEQLLIENPKPGNANLIPPWRHKV